MIKGSNIEAFSVSAGLWSRPRGAGRLRRYSPQEPVRRLDSSLISTRRTFVTPDPNCCPTRQSEPTSLLSSGAHSTHLCGPCAPQSLKPTLTFMAACCPSRVNLDREWCPRGKGETGMKFHERDRIYWCTKTFGERPSVKAKTTISVIISAPLTKDASPKTIHPLQWASATQVSGSRLGAHQCAPILFAA